MKTFCLSLTYNTLYCVKKRFYTRRNTVLKTFYTNGKSILYCKLGNKRNAVVKCRLCGGFFSTHVQNNSIRGGFQKLFKRKSIPQGVQHIIDYY